MDKITTKQAVSLIRLINKMGIKDDVINVFLESGRLEKEKQIILGKLYNTLEDRSVEITNELTVELFISNPELHVQYKDLEREEEIIGINLVAEIVLAIPNAEKDFYKSMAEIYGTSIKSIEDKDVFELIKGIINIFNSPYFMGFFNSTIK